MGLACMVFLPFNMPKARVFMGDVGSVLLGFVFAGLVVGLSYSLNDFMVLCAFLFPFYADELITLYVRLRDDSLREGMSSCGTDESLRDLDDCLKARDDSRCEWDEKDVSRKGAKARRNKDRKRTVDMLMQPHRGHVYQLLANEMGIDHWKVSVGYGALQLVVGIGALTLRGYGDLVVVAFLGCCFVGFWVISFFVRR